MISGVMDGGKVASAVLKMDMKISWRKVVVQPVVNTPVSVHLCRNFFFLCNFYYWIILFFLITYAFLKDRRQAKQKRNHKFTLGGYHA